MSNSHIPSGSVSWTVVRDNPLNWVVEETTSSFLAHPTQADAVISGPHVIDWDTKERQKARRWLRKEAKKDKASLMDCNNCGKRLYRKSPKAPYCSDACQKFKPK